MSTKLALAMLHTKDRNKNSQETIESKVSSKYWDTSNKKQLKKNLKMTATYTYISIWTLKILVASICQSTQIT